MIRAPRWDLLPKVSRPAARALNTLAAHLLHREAGRAGPALPPPLGDLRLSWQPPYSFPRAELAARLAHGAWTGVRVARADGRALALVVDAALATRLAASLFGAGAAAAELPAPRDNTPAERGALAAMVAAVLEARALPGLVVEAVGPALAVVEAAIGDAHLFGVDLRVSAAGAAGVVRVLAGESLAALPPPPLQLGGAPLETLRLRRPLVVGRTRLSAVEVAGLAAGDVVLLPRAMRDRALLETRHGGFPARLFQDRIEIVGSHERREGDAMADMDESLARELTVPVACRLGQVEMSVAELLALGPGAVIALGRPLGAPVELVAGERLLARGELVDVDGELGVRLTELLR